MSKTLLSRTLHVRPGFFPGTLQSVLAAFAAPKARFVAPLTLTSWVFTNTARP